MKRRKFVLGVGSLAAGASAAIGTGAVNQMQMDDRGVNFQITPDTSGNALMRFTDVDSGSPNSWTVRTDGRDRASIQRQSSGRGSRINIDSTFDWYPVFGLQNNDNDQIDVWIELQGSNQYVLKNLGTRSNSSNKTSIGPGNTGQFGLHLDTHNFSPDQVVDLTMTIHGD